MNPAMATLQKMIPQLVLLSRAALTALIGWQLALATWQLWPRATDTLPARQAPAQAIRSLTDDSRFTPLDDLQLFGAPPVATESVQAPPTVAPVSRLAARITGLAASSDPKQSRVIIQLNGEEKVYYIGEKLSGANARIENIYPDRVIIDHNGKFESLLMYADEADTPRSALSSAPQPEATSLKERLQQDPASWSDLVSIAPVMAAGKLQGYRLSPGKQPELLHKFGLKAGDLATAINGQDLTNPQTAMKLMTELPSMKTLAISVLRDGQPVEVRVSF